MISRRNLILAFGASALAVPYLALAQRQKIYRIGYLANDPDRRSPTFQAFIATLQERGWIEGKNIVIDYLTSDGRDERFPALAADAVQKNVDIIVTTGSGSTAAAKAATDRIPIVFGSAANPVEQKFVGSLARPGGNITGLALLVQELEPKRLQILKEILPRATRFARLYQGNTTQPINTEEDDAAARALGVALQHIAVAGVDEIDNVFAAVAKNRPDAIMVKADSMFVVNRSRIAALAIKYRLPMMCADGRFAEAGALLSYGEDFASRYRRAALLVDKILRGAKPADLPVEQSTIFELVINVNTATALGITIPQPVLLQADRVVK